VAPRVSRSAVISPRQGGRRHPRGVGLPPYVFLLVCVGARVRLYRKAARERSRMGREGGVVRGNGTDVSSLPLVDCGIDDFLFSLGRMSDTEQFFSPPLTANGTPDFARFFTAL
jgi:hypothetical protein